MVSSIGFMASIFAEITEELKTKVKETVAKKHTTQSEVIRLMLIRYINENGVEYYE